MKRLYRWILFGHSNAVIYGIATVAGALPLLLSFLDNSFHDAHLLVHGKDVAFKGLNASRNWWIFTVCLPLSLWLLRLSLRQVVGESPDAEPPLAQLTEDHGARAAEVRGALLDGRTPIAVLLLMVLIACVDMANVVPSYLHRTIPKEPDWTTMFLAHAMRARYDAMHVAIAYTVQYATGFLALLAFAIFLVHNIIYLKLIYQRRRTADPAPFIALKLKDPLCCFGQDVLRPAFRLQVVYVVLAGVAVSCSRYHNVSVATMTSFWEKVLAAIEKAEGFGKFNAIWNALVDSYKTTKIFPDGGQWTLAVLFLVVFLIAGLPSLIKFLPIGKKGMLAQGDMRVYLAEFLPPGADKEPMAMTKEELNDLASDFAENSFWPASDEVAKRLFLFAFAVLVFILLPVPLKPFRLVVIYAVLLFGFALLLTLFTFAAYEWVLAYFGKPLVKPRKRDDD